MFCINCGTKINDNDNDNVLDCYDCGFKTYYSTYYIFEEKMESPQIKIWHIIVSYILAIIIPFIGIICGVYLIYKEKIRNGAGVIITSIIMILFYI